MPIMSRGVLVPVLFAVFMVMHTGCQSAAPTMIYPPNAHEVGAWALYGDQSSRSPTVRTVDELDRLERNVAVTGTISRVSGDGRSWAELITPGGQTLLVRPFRRSFALSQSAIGRRAIIRGDVERRLMSIDEQQFLAREMGADDEALIEIATPALRTVFYARGMAIEQPTTLEASP